jgi:lambda family phage portal protein
VLEALKQVTRYTEAELTAAIVRTFLTVFFEQVQEFLRAGCRISDERSNSRRSKISLDPNEFELGAGSINVLPPGYKATAIDAGRSISAYESFANQLIRQIAACLEQPYEVLIKAFAASYSASRAALLQAWAAYRMRRIWFARDFCQPVYEAWLAEAVAIGRIEASGFFDDPRIRKAWCGAEWYGPVMGVLDPVKEAQGAILRIQAGLSTGEREAAEMTGTDFDENIALRAMELRAMAAQGVEYAPITTIRITEKGGNDDE